MPKALNWESLWDAGLLDGGVSMGRAIAVLIDRELVGVFGDQPCEHPAVFVEQAEEELATAGTGDLREEKAAAVEEHPGGERPPPPLGGGVGDRVLRVEFAAKMTTQPADRDSDAG